MNASPQRVGRLLASIAVTLGAALGWPTPAAADVANVCMQTNYTAHGFSQTLNCTANDVRVARATNINILSGGECTTDPVTQQRVCKCFAGGDVTFLADYEVQLTAQARYDVGVYFSVDGDPPVPPATKSDGALSGRCKLIDLDRENAPSTFIQLDTAQREGEECGDIDAAHNPQIIHAPLTVACTGGAGEKLRLPNCTSWRQPGSNDYCGVATDAYPGSPSKCHCDPGFTVDIFVEHPTIAVEKAASPVALYETGGDVTYTVTVTNQGAYTSVTLATVVDDPDNNTGTANSVSYLASAICQATTLAPGASTTCTFSRSISGNAGDSFTDKACVSGTDSYGVAVGPTCDTASVSIADVIPTAVLTKTADKLLCAVIQYKVKVENTDVAEALTLSDLTDDLFGSIAKAPLGTKVTGTTCTVPQTIAVGGNYQCTFEALVCTFPHTNTLQGVLSDNDGNEIKPTGSATVSNATLTLP